MTNATDQFVEDFTIVVDNDQDAYNEARECANSHTHLHEISDCMREQYNEAMGAALELLRESDGVEPVTVDIMSQILLGWGTAAFDRIARHYQGRE